MPSFLLKERRGRSEKQRHRDTEQMATRKVMGRWGQRLEKCCHKTRNTRGHQRARSCPYLISDSWPPELCGCILLLFKPPHLWQLLGHKYMLHINSLWYTWRKQLLNLKQKTSTIKKLPFPHPQEFRWQHPAGREQRGTKEPFDEGERGE